MKKFILLMLFSSSAFCAVQGTFTPDLSRYSDKLVFTKCNTLLPVPSSMTVYLMTDGTLQQDTVVLGVPHSTYGYWSVLDAKGAKIRFTYTGSAADQTGDWWAYFYGLQTNMNNYCGSASLYAPSMIVKKAELSIKTIAPLIGSGTASMRLQVEFYGYSNMHQVYSRGMETISTLGVMTWN